MEDNNKVRAVVDMIVPGKKTMREIKREMAALRLKGYMRELRITQTIL